MGKLARHRDLGQCPFCGRVARFYMGWPDRDGNKVWRYVCAVHDRYWGKKNLEAAGHSPKEAAQIDREIVSLDSCSH